MLKAIQLYNLYIPATLEIYLEEVRKLVDFEIITPDGLL